MGDAQIEHGDELETADGAAADSERVKAPRGFDSVALRELRRARKLIREAGTEEIPPEANLAVGIANVLALLDLAAAIRETTAGSDGESSAE